MQQIGFTFGDAAPAFTLAAPGTWCPDRYSGTAAAHTARLDAAEAALVCLAGPARPLFAQHIAAEREGLAAQVKRMAYLPGDVFEVWGVRQRFDVEEVTPLLEHCRAMVGSDFEGIEYKRQDRPQMASAGLYVRGVGTMVVRIWPGLSAGIDFRLIERDTFFLDGFRDGSPTVDAPANLWPRNMCQRFCESETAVPVAMTKTINGREYLVSGTTTGGQGGATAEAWTLVPAAQWDGPTFTYRTMINAYDAGSLERGDHRGQLVTVRGVLCVLESYALLTDANGLRNYLDRDTSEDEPEQLADDEELSEEDAEALELCD